MTDLVKRLRHTATMHYAGYAIGRDVLEAADTIERLERELAEARAPGHRAFKIGVGHQERATAAEQSRDEALKRLAEIAEIARRINSSGGYTLEERLDRIATIANEATEKDPAP